MEVCIILMYAFVLMLASVIFLVVLIELIGDFLNLFLNNLRDAVLDYVLFFISRVDRAFSCDKIDFTSFIFLFFLFFQEFVGEL